MFSSPGSIIFSLGPITVRWYGLLIACGIGLAYWYAAHEAKQRKLSIGHMDNMVLWLVISGVVGARLYYVLFNFGYFSTHPAEILQIWHGGLAIHGALAGGAVAFFTYCRLKKISPFAYLDAFIPGVLLAQAIGRWGNFFNNEAFGRSTELPWKLFIPSEFRPAGYEDFMYFHPTFLYESLWNIVGFALLVLAARKYYQNDVHRRPGLIFALYLSWYSVGRFFIEGLRLDSLMLGQFRIAQLVSAVLFSGGVFTLLFLYRRNKIEHNP